MEFKFAHLQVRTVDLKSITIKQQLMFQIAQTYYLLELMTTATIHLKIMLQELWLAEISRDEPIPLHILEKKAQILV